MNGQSIPDGDHVLRHVKGRLILDGDISGAAFRLRENESHLSFNWMEFDTYRNHTVQEQFAFIKAKFPLTLGRKDQFVRLNIGHSKNSVATEHPTAKKIDFIEDGKDSNPSHCYMTVQEIDDMVGDLLAQCILQRFPCS